MMLGAIIRKRRLALGLTQQRLARRMGWDDNQVWIFESWARGGPGTAGKRIKIDRVDRRPGALVIYQELDERLGYGWLRV